MTSQSRRGFTLIELLVALILLVLVGGGIYGVLNTVQRVTGKQTQSAAIQGNLRTGIQLIQSELQEISTNSGDGTSDIISMSGTLLRYRAARGLGVTCGTPTVTNIKIRKSSYSGLRDPAGNNQDELWIFWDVDTLRTDDDKWSPVTITSVGASTTCPDGAAAYDLTVSGMLIPPLDLTDLTDLTGVPSLGAGSIPVRVYETMEIGPVTDAGQEWLGIRSVSAGEADLVPVAGPLTASGIEFSYYEKDGDPTTALDDVTTIRIFLRGASTRNVHTKMDGTIGALTDSLTIRAQLRNSQ